MPGCLRRALAPWAVALCAVVGLGFVLSVAAAPARAEPAESVKRPKPYFLFWATHPLRGTDVYQSDGTVGGTRAVFDTVPYDGKGATVEMFGLGERTLAVVSSADDASRTRPGIYRLDPAAGPVRLGDRNLLRAIEVRPLGIFGGRLLVEAFTPAGFILYDTDGTGEGTLRHLGVPARTTVGVFEMGGRMLLLSNEYIQDRRGTDGRLYEIDLAGTQRTKLFDFRADGGSIRWSDPQVRVHTRPVAVVGPAADRFVFWRETPGAGIEPWVSDGTQAGTRLLRNIGANRTDGYGEQPNYLPFGDSALFVGLSGRHGAELWITDGTPEGTRMLRDIFPGRVSSEVRLDQVVSVGDRVFFPANDTSMRRGLWASDGTPEGTARIPLIHAGKEVTLAFNGPQAIAVVGGALVFMGQTSSGDCPSRRSFEDPKVCRHDHALYRYDPAKGRLMRLVQTTPYACEFESRVTRAIYSGGSYGSLMSFARGMLFPGTGRPALSPLPACGAVPMDIEPWLLNGRKAREIVQIGTGLTSSDPEFIGSSLCAGRC